MCRRLSDVPPAVPAKRHHYLPEAYLSGFTRGGTAESEFAVFDRQLGVCRTQTPKNTAVQNYYYAMETIDGTRSTRAEEVLSKVEGLAMPLLRRIDARGALSHADQAELAVFVALLLTRVPKYEGWIRRTTNDIYKHVNELAIATPEQAEYWIRRHEEKTGDRVNITSRELYEYIQRGEYDVVAHQNTIVRTMFDVASPLSLLLVDMPWMFAVAPPETSFITTDAPFVTTSPENHRGPFGIGTPGAMTLVPLSQRVCLCLSGRARIIAYRDMPKYEVRQINIALAQKCERFIIARDEALLTNIVRKSRAAVMRGPEPQAAQLAAEVVEPP